MKIVSIIAFILFLVLTVYVLMTKKIPKGHPPKKLNQSWTSKSIGEKQSKDIPAYELQRQRIDNETVYTFESKNSGEIYELDEEELSEFAESLKGLRKAPDVGIQGNFIHPNQAVQEKREKEYYEIEEN